MKLKQMKVIKGPFTKVVRTHFYGRYDTHDGYIEYVKMHRWCKNTFKENYERGSSMNGAAVGVNFYIDCPKSVTMFKLRYGHLFEK